MTNNLTITPGLTLVSTPSECLKITFYEFGANPLFPMNTTDERGVFYALDYPNIRPHLEERTLCFRVPYDIDIH